MNKYLNETEIKDTNWPGATQIKIFENEAGLSDLEHRVNVYLALNEKSIKVLDVKLTATEPTLGEKHYTAMVVYEVKGEVK